MRVEVVKRDVRRIMVEKSKAFRNLSMTRTRGHKTMTKKENHSTRCRRKATKTTKDLKHWSQGSSCCYHLATERR
ncbi:hypothetical protein UPYG_G00305290 [Umbra pygmaea]|uniref:Uncharacterized protein n=1 Tax=Umbra pygmaea TaxID=75934 RepID=A0ABD0WGJ0_UMBPY